MRTGKVSENVLKRSILKRCRSKQEDMVQGPGVGRDCAIFHVKEKNYCMTSVETVIVMEMQQVRHGIFHAVNNLICGGAEPISVSLGVTLPENAEESDLRAVMDVADDSCREAGVAISGGHTEVSSAVKKPIVTICAMGMASECIKNQICPGLDLVMTGYAGMEGTAILARAKEQELLERFPLDLVRAAQEFDKKLSLEQEGKIAAICGASAMHDISQGGVFGALWELCERHGIGMEAELKKIPLKQETVEICELLGLNPYCLLSGGASFIAVEDGQHLVMELAKNGIASVLIGRTTDKKDKVLLNGEECRFLEKPAQDEMLR